MKQNQTTKKLSLKEWILLLAILLLLFGNIYQFTIYSWPKIKTQRAENQSKINVSQRMSDIEKYLDQISPDYIQDEKDLASQYNVPSWGCGPSSYALAKIINKKFFGNSLPINAVYDNAPFEIVERFAFANDANQVVDHAWLEIYLNNKILFIDPTLGQFGKVDKIVYQELNVSDDISQIFLTDYSIYDIRFSILLKKAINRIPKDQPPYPGATIVQSSIPYYMQVLDDRDQLIAGQEPSGWTDWTNTLTQKYN